MEGDLAFFELGVGDSRRGREFYEGLFGWQFGPGPGEGGFTIQTPGVGGGMHGDDPSAAPYLFFEVEDMEAAIGRVRDLGGAIEETDVEGDAASIAEFGRFKLCRDNQGSRFGLHEPPRG